MQSTTYPEPNDVTIVPGPDAISASFHELGISDSRGQSQEQHEEQLKIDNLFLHRDEDEGNAEELGRAEADMLLAPNASEDEEESTISERPATVPLYAPFTCRDIRFKSLKDRTAAVDMLNKKKLKYGPRKPVYSTIRAPAEDTPPVTAVSRQPEARPVLRPSRLKKLMSLKLHPVNFTIPPLKKKVTTPKERPKRSKNAKREENSLSTPPANPGPIQASVYDIISVQEIVEELIPSSIEPLDNIRSPIENTLNTSKLSTRSVDHPDLSDTLGNHQDPLN